MKTLQVSDEVYEKLLRFVVDPFDDTADIVIGRVTEIAEKAKEHFSHLEARRRGNRGPYFGPERRQQAEGEPSAEGTDASVEAQQEPALVS